MGTDERTAKAKDTHYNDSPIYSHRKSYRVISQLTTSSVQLKISRIQLDTSRGKH